MNDPEVRFVPLALRAAACHTLTYVLMGMLAFNLLHYAGFMANPANGMRPASDPLILAGPLFQPLRGLLFATVFYPLRGVLFGRRRGWLLLAWLLVALGILGPFAAAPGSLEGFVYLLSPIAVQMRGWLEIVTQAVLFAALLAYWQNHARTRWLNWVLGTLFVLVLALPVLGLLAGRR